MSNNSCFQCVQYRAGSDGFIAAYCEKNEKGFPFIGDDCQKYQREPGADDGKEWSLMANYIYRWMQTKSRPKVGESVWEWFVRENPQAEDWFYV